MDVSQPVGIGSDFLGYRIEELIGRGGMGVVYRAYDLRLKRPVALKLVAPSLARDDRFRERFARESELVMSLEHPNVVPIYDAGDVDARVYLAMRLVDGSDLGSVLRAEGALEPARAVAISTQIAAALDAAHARGLVHRDVKPSNVLLDGSEHVYLADFGLTRRIEDDGGGVGEDFTAGTPAFLAPEQLDGRPVGGAADIYALGCVLYECLTGEPVFPRASRLAVAWAHLEEEPPKPSRRRAELPEAIDAVVGRALTKEPEQRFASCGALIAAAGKALGLETMPQPRRRRTLLVAGATALAAAAATAIAAVVVQSGNTGRPLLAGPNTLARINPVTKRVTAVVRVGRDPVVSAGSGHSVWVYGKGSGTIDEVDTRTNLVIKKTAGRLVPSAACCGVYSGPVLAADASGAWFVNGGSLGDPRLVHVPVKGRMHWYPLRVTPTGVAVGDGSVWIVGHTSRGGELLRVNPSDGRVAATKTFPASARISSIAFGFHAVWVVSSARSTLYEIAPGFRWMHKVEVVPHSPTTRPELIAGDVWVKVQKYGGLTTWYYPPVLSDPVHREADGPPSASEEVWLPGVLWWSDWRTGAVSWETHILAQYAGPPHAIPVASVTNGQCLTSITTAGGGVWATVAPVPGNYDFNCQR